MYRQPAAPDGSATSFAAAVAEIEELIQLLRDLEDAERYPRKARPIHVNELRPKARQAIRDNPLTRDRADEWIDATRHDELDELIEYLKAHTRSNAELCLPTRGDSNVLVAFLPVVVAPIVGVVIAVPQGDWVGVVVLGLLALAGLTYLTLWSLARVGSVRAVHLSEDSAWLPATGFSLRSHRCRYEDISQVKVHGHADRKLMIVTPTGVARFAHHALDVRELARELEERIGCVQRQQKVVELFSSR